MTDVAKENQLRFISAATEESGLRDVKVQACFQRLTDTCLGDGLVLLHMGAVVPPKRPATLKVDHIIIADKLPLSTTALG